MSWPSFDWSKPRPPAWPRCDAGRSPCTPRRTTPSTWDSASSRPGATPYPRATTISPSRRRLRLRHQLLLLTATGLTLKVAQRAGLGVGHRSARPGARAGAALASSTPEPVRGRRVTGADGVFAPMGCVSPGYGSLLDAPLVALTHGGPVTRRRSRGTRASAPGTITCRSSPASRPVASTSTPSGRSTGPASPSISAASCARTTTVATLCCPPAPSCASRSMMPSATPSSPAYFT